MLGFILPCSFFNELLRSWDIIPLWNEEEKTNIYQLTFPINYPYAFDLKGSMLRFILPCGSYFNHSLWSWDYNPSMKRKRKNLYQLIFPINFPCLRFKGSMLRFILPWSFCNELLRSWDIIPLWKGKKTQTFINLHSR